MGSTHKYLGFGCLFFFSIEIIIYLNFVKKKKPTRIDDKNDTKPFWFFWKINHRQANENARTMSTYKKKQASERNQYKFVSSIQIKIESVLLNEKYP